MALMLGRQWVRQKARRGFLGKRWRDRRGPAGIWTVRVSAGSGAGENRGGWLDDPQAWPGWEGHGAKGWGGPREEILSRRCSCAEREGGRRGDARRSALAIGRKEGADQTHGLMTAAALRNGRGWGRHCRRGAELKASAGVQLHAQTVGLGGRMTEAVVADGPQPLRQHMAQIALHKLPAGNSRGLLTVAGIAIFPAEGN